MEKEVIVAREKSIQDFKEFSQNEMNADDYNYSITDEGFAISHKTFPLVRGAALAMAIAFSEATHNFKYRLYMGGRGVEVLCYY